MRRYILWIGVLGLVGGCAAYAPPPGHGGIPPGHGGIPPGQAKKMGPPPLVVVGAPRYVLVPGTNVSVMLDVEADIFVVNGVYYYSHGGTWYTARTYQGSWAAIAADALPAGLRGKSPQELKAKVKGPHKAGHAK